MGATWWTDASELDPEQGKVVSLGPDQDHLILGPPGSGKTNLLLLRATYIYKRGQKNISVLVFGRVLREFVATGTEHYPFSSDKVETYVRWGTTLLRDNGIKFEGSGDLDAVRDALLEKLVKLADADLEENKCDCILLDEAQDYSPEELGVIRRFAKHIFVVGDDKQRITDKHGALNALMSGGLNPILLKSHYRNGPKICRVADGIRNMLDHVDGMEATSNYDDVKFPSSVTPFSGLALEKQVEKVVERIQTELIAYPGELVGVLCPRVDELKKVAALLAESSLASLVHVQQAGAYTAFDPAKPIVLATIHGAKGLEFRTLHLVSMDCVKRFPAQKNMSYTAVTRAKTTLSIYHEASLPGYLEKGIQAASGEVAAAPSLDDLFLKD